MTRETADRLKTAVAKWIHTHRNTTPFNDCSDCYHDAGDTLRAMENALGGKGTDDLAALIAHFKELPTWTR